MAGRGGPLQRPRRFCRLRRFGLIACILAGVHGGDLKLLAALGATLGLLQTANVMIVALSCAILYSLLTSSSSAASMPSSAAPP